mmetsp:Transcript_15377/g.41539  ORF Transcript_15377/g.41539 Transcript_15377/m.41539 type:complete len:132 (-) Transcript_15377:1-396(-)
MMNCDPLIVSFLMSLRFTGVRPAADDDGDMAGSRLRQLAGVLGSLPPPGVLGSLLPPGVLPPPGVFGSDSRRAMGVTAASGTSYTSGARGCCFAALLVQAPMAADGAPNHLWKRLSSEGWGRARFEPTTTA